MRQSKSSMRYGRTTGGRSGQSLIESCIVLALACVLFFGVLQLSQIIAAKEFLDYSAGRGARARTVGLNQFMTWKTARVGTIPNAGKMISPAFSRTAGSLVLDTPDRLWGTWRYLLSQSPLSEQYVVEESRIPLYLGSEWQGQLRGILDYQDWDTVHIASPAEDDFAGTVRVTVEQDYPLRFPFHTAFYADDAVPLAGRCEIENHYPLYLSGGD